VVGRDKSQHQQVVIQQFTALLLIL